MSLPPAAVDLLSTCASLSLAFADAVGPWAVTLYFAFDAGGDMFFTSSAGSRHGKLPPGQTAAATISRDSPKWQSIRGIQCSGSLEPVREADRDRVRSLYLARFADLASIVATPQGSGEGRIAEAFARNPFYVLRPRMLRVIDNRDGFASRTMFVRGSGGRWAVAGDPPTLRSGTDCA